MSSSPIVATIPTGIPIKEFSRQSRALTRKHGDGLLMRQHKGEFLVLTNNAPEFDCWCTTCADAVDAWLDDAGLDHQWRGFIVCPDCGSKRCPRAANCARDCEEAPDGR